MKKEIKRKRSNSSKKTTRYQTKNIKQRVTKKNKLKGNVKLAALLACIAIVIISKFVLGTKKAILIGALLLVLAVIYFLVKLFKGKNKKKAFTTLLILILSFGIVFAGVFAAFLLYIKSIADPIYTEKEADLNTKETTTMYDKDGVEFAKLGSEMREKVSYEQLPEVLIDAIIATEDSRFFQHNGFDTPRFVKAAAGQLIGNKSAGGASTLSMQVVKNIFTDATADDVDMEGITRKFTDIYLAVFKLEKNYTKEQIIEFYVNNHFLGGNIYGVEEASQFYFGKSVSELNLSEAAIIAGMFKSPSYYRPDTHPENAEARRKTVLYLMNKHGYITDEEEQLANAVPVSSLVVENEEPTNEYQGFIDTVVAEIKSKYKVNAYTTSLKVYTTLDRGRQNAVNRVLDGETYDWIDDKVQTGVAVLDSDTGAILAVGAGRNRSGINSYNFATQIRRQPGSTAKPLFDYGPGIEYNNWSTYTLFDDQPYSYSNGRSIKNWDGGYYGTITLRRALSTSRNIPALKAFQQVNNDDIRDFVTSLGIKPELCSSGYSYDRNTQLCVSDDEKSKDTQDPMKLHEAHAIGAFTGVSPLEMSAAYAAFSNGGYYNEPYSVTKVIFRSTGETKEHEADKQKVMSDSTAFMISSVLKDVALTGGTPYNVACKTGTTNYDDKTMDDYNMPWDAIRDSWVIGYSTKTVIGMWYGYDRLNQDMVDQGYVLHNVPATIQKDRLFNALVNSGAMEGNRDDFVQPSSVSRVAVAAGSNPAKLAGPGSEVVYEYFKKGTEPTETDIGNARLEGPSNLKATYNESSKKVTLTWKAVDPGVFGNDGYGNFGYNIYLNDRLLTWTDKLSYTCDESDPFGTYKVIATYKSYSGLQSDASTVTVTEPKKEEEKKPTDNTSEEPKENEEDPEEVVH